LSFEELEKQLENCEALVVCPDSSDGSPDALEKARQGLKAVLASSPYGMTKVVLLSHVGAQEGKGGFNIGAFFGQGADKAWSNVEDELTSTARTRSSNRPLKYVIVRAGDPPADGSQGATEVQCVAGDQESAVVAGGVTSPNVAAEALFQVFNLSVDSNFAVVEAASPSGQISPDWNELMLPFIGPEIWRLDVADSKRAAFFVQGWAEEFFKAGKNAMRMGVKTPVMIQNTPSGVIFKFKPLGTAPE
ncbi:unnamed protein product, partial [Polarella glacialis]